MARIRADHLLVQRGMASSGAKAQALILSGVIFSKERRIEKSGELLLEESPLEIRGVALPYVSRGGLKLAAALDEFQLDPKGVHAVDVGASTGGFTDVLLQRGAARVWAVDVGYGQLHNKLRSDSRVEVFERTNARYLTPELLGLHGPELDWAVVDASFIGLEKLLPAIASVLRSKATLVALVKPQFQLKRNEVGKRGVVREDALRLRASADVANAATQLGFDVCQEIDCAIEGPEGNRERFLYAVKR